MMNATIENGAAVDPTPPSLRHPRFDSYGPIHKAMRLVMSDMLVRMGKTNFLAEDVAARLVADLEKLLLWCEQHIEHEVRFVHPQLAARLTNALEKIDEGHDEHARFCAELRSLMNGVTSAKSPELRALAGKTLYLHYIAYLADTLSHMVEEERVIQPLMHRFFTDEELLAMNMQIVASIPQPELFESLLSMIAAGNGPERATLLGNARAAAPPEAFHALIGAVRARLDTDEMSELVGLCPFLG